MKLPELLTVNPSAASDKVKAVRSLHPHRLSPNLSIDSVSTAQGDFLIDEGLQFGDWIRIYYPNGQNGVYRAATPEYNYDKGTVSITLNHATSTLGYDIIPLGDTADENGISEPRRWEKSLSSALTDALSYQTTAYWQKGTVEVNPNIAIEVDYPNLLDFINDMMRQVSNAYVEYNTDSFPWTLNVRQKPTTVTAEGRLSRNVTSAKVRYDDSDLCTRVWCDALTAKHMDSAKIALYGVRAHNYYLSDTLDQSFIQAACQRYLDNRDEPKVTITIDGADFSELTGVELDRFKLGELYRLEIVKYNKVFSEQIRQIQYADIIQQPHKLTLTLGNHTEDLSSLLAGNRKASSAGATASAKSRGTVSHVYEDLVKVNVESRNGVEEILHAAGLQWVDDEKNVMLFATDEWQTGEHAGKSVGSEIVAKADEAYMTSHNEFTQLAGVVDVVDDKASMSVGRYEVDNSKIHEVTKLPTIGIQGHCYIVTTSAGTNAYVYDNGQFKRAKLIQDSKGKRAVFIQAGEIAIAINESGDPEAVIDAKRVVINGGITSVPLPDWMDDTEGLIADKAAIGDLQAVTARVSTLEADAITTNNLAARIAALTNVTIKNAQISNGMTIGSNATLTVSPGGNISVPSSGLSISGGSGGTASVVHPTDFMTDVQIVSTGADGYKLQYKTAFDASWTDAGTFSRAAVLNNPVWSGGTVTVSVQGGGVSKSSTLSDTLTASGNPQRCNADGTANSNGKHIKQNYIINYIDPGSGGQEDEIASTGRIATTITNGTTLYNAGWTAALNTKVVSAEAAASSDIAIKTLTYDEKWKIKFTLTKADGTSDVSTYVVKAPTEGTAGYDQGLKDATVAYSHWSATGSSNVGNNNIINFINSTTGSTQTASRAVWLTEDGSFSSKKKYVYLRDSSGSGTIVGKIQVDASSVYNSGWTAAYGKVSLPSSSSGTQYITVQTPPSTVDGSATSTRYYVTSENNVAYIRVGSTTGTTLASYTHNKYNNGYNAGWGAAYNRVSVPQSGSAQYIIVKTPPSTVDGAAAETKYYVTSENNVAYIRVGSASGTTVASVTHNRYNMGYNAAVSSEWLFYVTPDSSWSKQSTFPYGNKVACGYTNTSGSRSYRTGSDGKKAYWEVPPDRYQDGYSAGYNDAAGSITPERHSFWKYVGLYQSRIVIEGETYSLYCASDSRQTYATDRAYM